MVPWSNFPGKKKEKPHEPCTNIAHPVVVLPLILAVVCWRLFSPLLLPSTPCVDILGDAWCSSADPALLSLSRWAAGCTCGCLSSFFSWTGVWQPEELREAEGACLLLPETLGAGKASWRALDIEIQPISEDNHRISQEFSQFLLYCCTQWRSTLCLDKLHSKRPIALIIE